ncbi:MAG TPA: flagellar hook basal-body protein [Lacipirellulaceae bacterium]|nr:flagellar hook basal-body protein [Lacipirellulaceae bacterium]
MSLGSVLQTAVSGMLAATTSVRVASNNVANARTAGFKASRPVFTTQPSSTIRAGSAPSPRSGGTNPVQVGLGVKVAGIATDFSQGSIVASSNPLDVALEGEGFLIVEGPTGASAYTPAGSLHLNAHGEIVTAAGDRLLGFGVNEQFQVQGGQLQPLSVPFGSSVENADGSAATLVSVSITDSGRIRGEYSDGADRDLGQIRIAQFTNPSGLEADADSRYQMGANSGLSIESNPGEDGGASLVAGATELSNADIGQNLIDLFIASDYFRANAAVFRTADSLLDELTGLSRAR